MENQNQSALKQLLEATKYMIDESQKDAPYDSTVRGRIVSGGTQANTYVVSIYDKQYTIPSAVNKTFVKNDVVWVTIPQNNMNNAFISAIKGGQDGSGGGGGGGGTDYQIGPGLKVENGVLSVDTINQVLEDNTQPVTSGAVYMELGNVEALLASI